MPTDLVIPTLRPEWVKMANPGEPEAIVVCEVLFVQHTWVALHATSPSQFHPPTRSPGGIDEGTVRYLRTLGEISRFNLFYEGFGRLYRIPFADLVGALDSGMFTRNVRTRSGQFRRRIFLPEERWVKAHVHTGWHPPTLPYKDETRITAEGVVMWRTAA